MTFAENIHRWTALMKTAASGYKYITELLLKKGGDLNIRSSYGYTALMMAREVTNNSDMIKLLEDAEKKQNVN